MIRMMVSIPANKLLRGFAVLGILLLLAVQEKVCPWLAEDLAAPPGNPRQEPARDSNEEEPQAPPLTFASVLPDTVPPRSAATHGGVRLAPTKRRSQRIGDEDSLDGSRPTRAIERDGLGRSLVWVLPLDPTVAARPIPVFARLLVRIDPSLTTVITRTGPPTA